MSSAIAIQGLRVERGGSRILRDIDLTVPSGGVFGLIGPSGSGKTTLIRSIAGLQRIAAGSITVDGVTAGTASLRREIGYMPQSPAVYEDLTARENLAFLASTYRVERARVDEVLRLVDLTDIADRTVSTYSGGQRQRVSLAAAILPNPSLLLLDEPTVGLDPRLRVRLWSLFRAWASGGKTVIVSTHVMDEAAKTDRIAFLLDGQLVLNGTPGELVTQAGAVDLESAVLSLTADPGDEAR